LVSLAKRFGSAGETRMASALPMYGRSVNIQERLVSLAPCVVTGSQPAWSSAYRSSAMPSCLMFDAHTVCRARALAALRAGSSNEARTAMIAMTTSSSISVNAVAHGQTKPCARTAILPMNQEAGRVTPCAPQGTSFMVMPGAHGVTRPALSPKMKAAGPRGLTVEKVRIVFIPQKVQSASMKKRRSARTSSRSAQPKSHKGPAERKTAV